MIATVTLPFYDKVEGVDRKPGETFEVTQARLDEINAAGYGTLAAVVAAGAVRARGKARSKAEKE